MDFRTEIAQLYVATFNRAPDAAGLDYWETSGLSIEQIAQSFFDQPETQTKYPSDTTNASFVTEIYNNLFGRSPDAAGLAYWTAELASGNITRDKMILAVINGAQDSADGMDKTTLANKAEVGLAYADAGLEGTDFSVSAITADATTVENALDVISYLGGDTNPDHTFTLKELTVSVTTDDIITDVTPNVQQVLYWGDSTTHEGVAFQTVVASYLNFNNIKAFANNEEVLANLLKQIDIITQSGVLDALQGAGAIGDNAIVNEGPVNTITVNDDGSVVVTGNQADGDYTGEYQIVLNIEGADVVNAQVTLTMEQFEFFNNMLFDANGNSRLFEVTVTTYPQVMVDENGNYVTDVNEAMKDAAGNPILVELQQIIVDGQTIKTNIPLILTPTQNNGSTEEADATTTSSNDLIVAGRLDILHGAYIDGGAGVNTLEIDAKGYFAQPKELINIQNINIENLPNIYTDRTDGSNDYPVLQTDGAGNFTASVIDISRAVDLENLTITEGSFPGLAEETEQDAGVLSVTGVRADAVLTLEGSFTKNVTVDFSEGMSVGDDGVNVVLRLGDTEGVQFDILTSSATVNIDSQGGGNAIDATFAESSLMNMNISGDAKLQITNSLDQNFQAGHPATINASSNTAGVDLTINHFNDEVVFTGTVADDHFNANSNGKSVLVNTGTGDDEISANDGQIVVINAADGNNEISATNANVFVTVNANDGANSVNVSNSTIATVTLGDGNNQIIAMSTEESVIINAGDGKNIVDVSGSNDTTVTLGEGNNIVKANAVTDLNVTTGNGNNSIESIGSVTANITTQAGNDNIVVSASTINIDSAAGNDTVKIAGNGGATEGQSSAVNLMFILDNSGSLSSQQLADTKAATIALLEEYRAAGVNIKVNVLTFSPDITGVNDWVSIDEAIAEINLMTGNGGTDFDDALNEAIIEWDTAGKIDNASNQVVFTSDGQSSISTATVDAWHEFLDNNDIVSNAFGMGLGTSTVALEPIAFDGITNSALTPIIVEDSQDLVDAISDTVTVVSGNTAVINIDLGSGTNTLVLGDADALSQGLVALEGSSIMGSDIKMIVNADSDLRASSIEGVTSVVLDNSDVGTATKDVYNATLTLTDVQFMAIGAENFSVEGAIFSTYAQIKIIVTQDISLTALGADELPSNIDLQLEVSDDATLTLTAQQLHTKVASQGITLANDGNEDSVSGKVVITGGGQDFDPFNDSDTVKSVINGNEYNGGSLSDDFMSGGSWYNVTLNSGYPGYDRPADALVVTVFTIDGDALAGEPVGTIDTYHTNVMVTGAGDVNFDGLLQLGLLNVAGTEVPTNPFTLDFSTVQGEVNGLTLDNFELLGQGGAVYGNGGAEVFVNIAADEANNTVGFDQVDAGSLVSSGVSQYTVTVIDGSTSAQVGSTATIKLCDTTQDLEVLALRGNWNDTLVVKDAAWGLVFELQGGSTLKADGPTGTSNVGTLEANYMWDGADAIVNITHANDADTRPIHVEGIVIDNATSITINADAKSIIESLDGTTVEDITFVSPYDMTLQGNMNAIEHLESLDASAVTGVFTLDLTGVNDLSEVALSNIDAIIINDGASLTITMEQADLIGAANFSGTGTLHLEGLSDQVFALANYGELTVTITIAELPEVTLNPLTDLTGIDALVIPEGTTLNMTMAQYQQLNGNGTITGGGSLHITDVTQESVGVAGADLDMDGVDIDGTITLTLAQSVDLSEADIYSIANTHPRVDTFNLGDAMTLTLGDIQDADGVDVNGGTDSILKFIDTDTEPFEDIDASGFNVTQLWFLNTITANGNRNIDDIFTGIPESVEKVIYNGQGWVLENAQVVTVTAGTTVIDSIVFNPVQNDVELDEFTLNLSGGTEIDGNLRLSTDEKTDVNGNELIRTYLRTVTINSIGTATEANLLSGSTANIITGDITPYSAIGGQDNNLLDITVNATQDFIVEGDIIFNSNTDGDSITANDIENATAILEVNGTADVTIGGVDTIDDDVVGLDVINNGTGTLTVTVDASDVDATDSLSFTGTGDIVLNTVGVLDLSNDTLTAVDVINVEEGSTLTLSYTQLTAIGATDVNVIDGTDAGTTIGNATLNINGYTGGAFDATAIDSHFSVVTLVLADQDVTLDPAVNLTNVTSITVQEGRTLTLTAAQFQQLKDNGVINGADTDGDLTTEAFNVVITGLTQADVNRNLDGDAYSDADDGFSLADVDTNGGSINITLGEASVDLGTLTSTGFVNASVINGASFTLADNQTLGLVNSTQADGLDVVGGTNSTIALRFDVMDGTDTSIDASGYSVTTLEALAGFVGGSNVEELLHNVASTIEERYYADPADILGFASSTYRVVTVEAGVTVPVGLIYNDYQTANDREVRTLDLTLEGGSKIAGNLNLSTNTEISLPQYFQTLTIHSEGTTLNTIGGNISADALADADTTTAGNQPSLENNLLNVVIDAQQDLEVTGAIDFNSINVPDDDAVANLTINGIANVTVQTLDVTDTDIATLNITNNSTGTFTVTGASPSVLADDTETINLAGTGDIYFGTAEVPTQDFADGINGGGDISVIDASGLSGDLTIENLEAIDINEFIFTSGTGVTNITLGTDGLDSTNGTPTTTDDTAGWIFDLSDAANGSALHLREDFASAIPGSKFTVLADASTTIYVDATMDLSDLVASLPVGSTIVVADGATLTLTAAQANGLTIVGANGAASTGVVNIADLGDAPVDLSGISADIAGTTFLEDNDVTLDAATDLGAFSITLDSIVDTSASLQGQTIRLQNIDQAERAIIVNETANGGLDNNDSSTNVVWLFDTVPAPVDTAAYDAALGRLWLPEALVSGANVENLFTTLPSTILRVDFGNLSALNVLLSSAAIDRIMEISSFNTVGNLTFNDIGIAPVEHLHSLTLELGGQVTVGNIEIADIIGAPGYDPLSVSFDEITIDSHRSVRTGDLYATEGYVNDNDGVNETAAASDIDGVTPGDQLNPALIGNENATPINMNTVGNLSVGATNGLDLLNVNLRTGAVTVIGDAAGPNADGLAGAGAALTVGTITYETDTAASAALLDIEGDNNITIAAVNTADADITGLTIDATGFTAVLDPVMHMDNTQTLTIMNDGGAPEDLGGTTDGTIILSEVEGDELSFIDASDFDGTLDITLTQIDSTNEDRTVVPDGDTTDPEDAAFNFTAGQGVETVRVGTVVGSTNVPTLNALSTWAFTYTGAAAGSELILSDTAVLAATSNLVLVDVPLVIEGDVDLTLVNLDITGGTIFVPAGNSLTLTVQQVLALQTAGLDITGSGTTYVTGNADDVSGLDLGTPLHTVTVDFSGIVLTIADGASPLVGDEVFEIELTGALDDLNVAVPQNVIGSNNDDAVDVTGLALGGVVTAGAGNDTIDTSGLGESTTFNVTSGTDTIQGLWTDLPSNVEDVLVVSAGATAIANLYSGSNFVATADTMNNGTAIINSSDSTVDMTLATGTNGFTLVGGNSVDLTDFNETLIGSNQADIINGGNNDQDATGEVDTLTGNGGADRFVFNTQVSSAAALTPLTTTAGVDQEIIDLVDTAAEVDSNNESVSITYTINGASDNVLVDLATIDVTSQSAIAAAIAAALDAKALISSTVNINNDIVITGDAAGSVTVTDVTWTNFTTLGNDNFIDGTDVAQVTTLTVSGTPTAGDIYSVIAGFVAGGGISTDYTALALDGANQVAAGLESNFTDGAITATVSGAIVTFTDTIDDDGGFILTIDTTAAFAGSGASDIGATALNLADVITDFNSVEDTISFGLVAGSGTNYVEAAAAADYATALTNADAAFNGTVQYYLTSSTADTTGLLFFDANLDGNVDGVVNLAGITSANFEAADIVA